MGSHLPRLCSLANTVALFRVERSKLTTSINDVFHFVFDALQAATGAGTRFLASNCRCYAAHSEYTEHSRTAQLETAPSGPSFDSSRPLDSRTHINYSARRCTDQPGLAFCHRRGCPDLTAANVGARITERTCVGASSASRQFYDGVRFGSATYDDCGACSLFTSVQYNVVH